MWSSTWFYLAFIQTVTLFVAIENVQARIILCMQQVIKKAFVYIPAQYDTLNKIIYFNDKRFCIINKQISLWMPFIYSFLTIHCHRYTSYTYQVYTISTLFLNTHTRSLCETHTISAPLTSFLHHSYMYPVHYFNTLAGSLLLHFCTLCTTVRQRDECHHTLPASVLCTLDPIPTSHLHHLYEPYAEFEVPSSLSTI